MFGHETCVKSIGTVVLAILMVLGSVSTAEAQCCGGGGGGCCSGHNSAHNDHDEIPSKPLPPDPYGGQIYCPVTGKKLGLQSPPVPVQTAIGEQPPSFWAKLRGQKGTPGAVIYVCCPACVAKVQTSPETYFGEVLADKVFPYRYASAPAQRPSRAREEVAQVSTAPAIPAAGPYGGQKTCPVTGHALGSMGAPVPVTVQGLTIYVCCRGCVAKVQRDPATYLRKVQAERGGP